MNSHDELRRVIVGVLEAEGPMPIYWLRQRTYDVFGVHLPQCLESLLATLTVEEPRLWEEKMRPDGTLSWYWWVGLDETAGCRLEAFDDKSRAGILARDRGSAHQEALCPT